MFHKQPENPFNDPNRDELLEIEKDELEVTIKAYKKCLYEYKYFKKVHDIEQLLVKRLSYIPKRKKPMIRKILISEKDVLDLESKLREKIEQKL